MIRDLTMIFAVLVSIFSLAFGVYKNFEAGNAKGFAYRQAYRILGIVDEANIAPSQKASIKDAALKTLGTPPPVIDLSRSSADAPPGPNACAPTTITSCIQMAGEMASLNALCVRKGDATDACAQADMLKSSINENSCITCFSN